MKTVCGELCHQNSRCLGGDRQLNVIDTDAVMKLVFESQEDGVTANQSFHLQQLAGAVLGLAA